jgi:glycosyltransferase involved in cell wall biosynthesis
MTLVSVITPSLNSGRFIQETIESVVSPYAEHIVIDGGSTDNTIDILGEYNIEWISEPDTGQSNAINKGFAMANGCNRDIIAYLNADDTYLDLTLNLVVSYFENHPETDMVYGDGIITDESGKSRNYYHCGKISLQDLTKCKCNVFQPSVFMRKRIVDDIGGMDEHLHLAMDLDYWIRVLKAGYSADYIPLPLSTAKVYPEAKSTKNLCGYIDEYKYILDKHGAGSAEYSAVYAKGGLDAIHGGRSAEGLGYLAKSATINPLVSVQTVTSLIAKFVRGSQWY